jgi:hypothetical protein
VPIIVSLISLAVGQFVATNQKEPAPYKKYNLWGYILNIALPIIGIVLGFCNSIAENNSLRAERDRAQSQYDSLLSSAKKIREFQTGYGSIAYFVLYGLYRVGKGMQQTDMVLWSEGENPIINPSFSVFDVGAKRTILNQIKLNDIMPKPKNPSSGFPCCKFPITESDLRLRITFNSNSLDYDEDLRLIIIDTAHIAVGYKVVQWGTKRILKIHYDSSWPYDTTKNVIWDE